MHSDLLKILLHPARNYIGLNMFVRKVQVLFGSRFGGLCGVLDRRVSFWDRDFLKQRVVCFIAVELLLYSVVVNGL